MGSRSTAESLLYLHSKMYFIGEVVCVALFYLWFSVIIILQNIEFLQIVIIYLYDMMQCIFFLDEHYVIQLPERFKLIIVVVNMGLMA